MSPDTFGNFMIVLGLLDEIWGYQAEAYDRTVDTHLYRLRLKLGVQCEISQRIVSVRGIGYKFERE